MYNEVKELGARIETSSIGSADTTVLSKHPSDQMEKKEEITQ